VSTFRFIHTADIHLDSPLLGLAGQDGTMSERIRSATRQAFEQLITLATEEKVDFLVIAGDLYDGEWRDYQTGLFFARQMGRLAACGIRAFVLYGNHDAASQITRRLVLPDHVSAFSSRHPETFVLDDLGVALHGQSYRKRDISENLVPAYPEPLPGMANLGVLHTGMGGAEGHANYAPCALDELLNKGYDYWALGHVHHGSVLHERPHVVFPGNLQARHINEAGPKSACLVTVEERDIVDVALLETDVVRWSLVSVELTGCDRLDDVVDRASEAMGAAAAAEADGRLLACRIQLMGRCPIHERLLASQQQLLAEARAAALGLGDEVAWIERVVVDTTPVGDLPADAQREDALGELQAMLSGASQDASVLQLLEHELGDLVRKLPHDICSEPEDALLRCAVDGDYAELVNRVCGSLAARLMNEEL
jgi:DNA repair protein SbcD/Mre11